MNISRISGPSIAGPQARSLPLPTQTTDASCQQSQDKVDIGHHKDASCQPMQLQKEHQAIQQQQSPIDIQKSIFTQGHSRTLDIAWHSSNAISVEPVQGHDHGRSAKALAQPKFPSITLEGKKFELQGFHFHSPSEHKIKGANYPMELHLVHQNPEDGTRAVVGVFIDGQGEELSSQNVKMHNFLEDFESQQRVNIEPDALLPSTSDKFYRYEGSLTTPGYDENVSWVVMNEPLHLAPDTLAELSQKFGHSAREVQDLNRRYVLSTFQD